jgi:Ca-activated chloride channel family protein
VDVHISVKDQIAKAQVSQVFQNISSQTIQSQIMFPIPDDAAISELTLLVDGKEFAGRLMKKDEARRVYESIVRQRKDPALLEYMGHGLFQTSVFPIPPGAERTVEIRYQQLLKKDNGLIDLLIPIGTSKHATRPVDSLNVTVRVNATDAIKTIYSPSHDVEIDRPNDRTAVCKISLRNVLAPDDFRLMYGQENGLVGMNVITYRPSKSEPGYFLLLASPELKRKDRKAIPKSVIFVLDRSGSMNGQKIKQARAALKYFLNQLESTDTFNIVAYDSSVESFRPELQRADEKTVQAALGFAEGIFAGGSTNIDGALKTSLGMLTVKGQPSYVLFLTDGLPTVGTRDEHQIAANALKANRIRARMFNFGVGFDVNSRLLDRLSNDHRGQSVYVRPNEDIETHVAALYNKIGSPLLTDLKVAIEFDRERKASAPQSVSRVYPRNVSDLFHGEQLVLVGRYHHGGAARINLTGQVGKKKQKFSFASNFTEFSPDESNGFVEKLWAIRRVGEIIDELDLRGQNQELVNELVQLSIKHGIMTPYTSFLADENIRLSDRRNRELAANATRELERQSGQSAFFQRRMKADLKSATRFSAAAEVSDSIIAPTAGQPASGPPGRGGFGGGARNGKPADAPARPRLVQDFDDFKKQQAENESAGGDASKNAQTTVLQLGQKTFFRKGKIWRDSTVTDEEEKKAIRIVQFSKEFFDLAASNDGKLAKYLVFDELVVMKLDGKTYHIVPEEPETKK